MQMLDATTQKEAGSQVGGRILRDGGLVAFPTETVYGLGANGFDGDAVRRIFEAKGRPMDNPLILHVSKKSDVKDIFDHVPPKLQRLMDAFWPGPLTIVFEKGDKVPDEVTAGLNTVAVRMPDNKTARALIKAAGVPIAAPSANASGRPSPTSAEHVKHDLDGRIDLIIDGGPCKYGLESTVISLAGTPTILRPGVVTQSMIEAVIGPVELAKSILSPLGENDKAASPGMKHTHYAPECDVIVVEGEDTLGVSRKIGSLYEMHTRAGKKCVIFAAEQSKAFYRNKECVIIGNREQPLTFCQNLFSCLRDAEGRADIIISEGLDAREAGLAFMNRLLRAAGFQSVKV